MLFVFVSRDIFFMVLNSLFMFCIAWFFGGLDCGIVVFLFFMFFLPVFLLWILHCIKFLMKSCFFCFVDFVVCD